METNEKKIIRTYRDLDVWQAAFQLSGELFELTKQFPTGERYGQISQIRRATKSITANIAEGYRQSTREAYRNYVKIAYGSASELESHILHALADKQGSPIALKNCLSLLDRVLRMLNRLSSALASPPRQPTTDTRQPTSPSSG